MRKILAICLFLMAMGANAAEEIQVWGRAYNYSCGYYSRRAADFSVTIKDDSLPFGTEISLIFGFGGEGRQRESINWTDRSKLSASAIDAATWEARIIDKTMAFRSEGIYLDRLQFVFEVKQPGKQAYFINGGRAWGYYETDSIAADSRCVRNGVYPDWHKIDFHNN